MAEEEPYMVVRVESGWTPALVEEYRKRFANGEACKHCGGIHARACPRVKRMAFHPNGSLSEIEFWPDGGWPSEDHVVWPELIPNLDDQKDVSAS